MRLATGSMRLATGNVLGVCTRLLPCAGSMGPATCMYWRYVPGYLHVLAVCTRLLAFTGSIRLATGSGSMDPAAISTRSGRARAQPGYLRLQGLLRGYLRQVRLPPAMPGHHILSYFYWSYDGGVDLYYGDYHNDRGQWFQVWHNKQEWWLGGWEWVHWLFWSLVI